MEVTKDKSREGATWEKVFQLGRLFRPKYNYAIAKVRKFTSISIERLLSDGFEGVILDIDENVAPHHGEVFDFNRAHIALMVQSGIDVVIFSNMKASNRYDILIQEVKELTGKEIHVIMSPYAKPDPRGFIECLDVLQIVDPSKAVMIGDNFVTDGGSIKAGIPFIKVKPIHTEEALIKKLKRSLQTGSRLGYSILSDIYDVILQREVITDKDMNV